MNREGVLIPGRPAITTGEQQCGETSAVALKTLTLNRCGIENRAKIAHVAQQIINPLFVLVHGLQVLSWDADD